MIDNFIEIKIAIFYRSWNIFLFLFLFLTFYTCRLVIHLNRMGRTASEENQGSLKYLYHIDGWILHRLEGFLQNWKEDGLSSSASSVYLIKLSIALVAVFWEKHFHNFPPNETFTMRATLLAQALWMAFIGDHYDENVDCHRGISWRSYGQFWWWSRWGV